MDDNVDPTLRTEPATGHFHVLDALRGLAALWVVLFHLTVSTTIPAFTGGPGGFVWETLFGRGSLGVAVFFVLSGFVITHSLRRGIGSAPALGSFMVRRVVRLTPPYWAAIVVAVAVHAVAALVNHEPFAPGGDALSPARLLSHLFYLEGLLGYGYINDVFWTLTVEMQFYIVLALFLFLVALVSRTRPAAFRSMVWVAGALSVIGARSGAAPQITFVPLFYSFFLGALLCWFRSKRVGAVDVGAYLVALGLVFVETPDAFLAASVLSGVLIMAVGTNANGPSRLLSATPFRWLGRISYSLYLVHVPVQGAVLLAVVRVIGTSPGAVVVASVLAVSSSLVAANVFWWAVEGPSLRWASSLKGRTPMVRLHPVPEPTLSRPEPT